MKKNDLEMAWNTPKDQEDPRKNSNQSSNGGDFDEILEKLKGRFTGKGNNRGGSDRGIGISLLFILPIALLAWLASGIYVVDAGKRGVVLFLGKKQAVTEPGIRWRFPSPIGGHRLIDIERRFSQKIGNTASQGANREAMMLTKDEAIVDIRVEVQYQIDPLNPERYWFASINPDGTLRDVVESAVRERVGQTVLDDILTSGREQLMLDVKELAQNVLNKYGVGLVITNVNLEDAQPPEPVQGAFSDAIRAREDEQSRRNQGEAYERQVVLEAEGEAAREINRAQAYRDSIIPRATGEADRFNQLLVAYEKAPEITRQRLYLEAMESVFKGTNKVLMGATKNNNLMMLPLEQLLKGNKGVNSSKMGFESPGDATNDSKSQVNSSTISITPSNSNQSSSDIRMRSRSRNRY